MTQKEIFNEINICKRKMSQLQKEVMTEDDFSVAKLKLEEMTNLANRIGELDTLHKKLLLAESENKLNKTLKTIKEMLGL